ncbi:hypothetical protein [Candidatus Enterococcus courvalinii]|uniref:Uncharacterized protein n=1 Tax=Candidatus Enterococcus courvalinii TaxID=2815329 RepID=A0ABS3I5M7_9ENTE|nr:hypothetical protein [Enterococcus sp. MSG2901]MBO0483091.1 hypothetical protein [Enterococcus sp. MSG2901]
MSSTKLKMIAGLFSVITITGSVMPTVTTFAAEKSPMATISAQTNSEEKTYVLNENNENYQKAIEYLENNASSATVKYFKEYFYGKTVTPDNQDQLMDGYLEFLSTKPQGKVALETILAIVASAIAIIQGMYSAGRYAAKQCVSRGILTKKSYKPNGGWIMAGITVSFGLPAALGFDDYMYDR